MKKLDNYYGNRRKIIRDCMAEVNSFAKVAPRNYKNLVALKSCIEVNYARLASYNMEGEISNTQTMKSIESKFPPYKQRKWTECLERLPRERQNQNS